MFEIVEKEPTGTIIKVVGVGGAGGNAVDHMIREGVQGVQFVSANTDAQALARCLAPTKIQLGITGLGAGSKPEAGRAAAQESREAIAAALEGAHMCFITGGMGGGTGTGAAPVVAEIAKEMGILCVAVVTKPFDFENRIRVAESGVEELTRHVDSLIVVLNDKLLDVFGDDAGFEECFRSADNVLRSAVGGIAEIINVPGLVNVDFQDVRTAMAEMGRAMMGSAEASGMDRARIAAEQAAVSPLLEGTELSGARCVLINITASKSLKMSEVRDAVKTVQAFAAPEAFVKYGTVFDESMEDRIRITVVATGLGTPRAAARQPVMQVVQGTGTYGPMGGAAVDMNNLDVPAVMRSGRRTTVDAMSNNGVGTYDIPAFLRRQAD
ncbi:cell division protein FtsZ [Azoarcus communis]|uniref:Cell division protein FtsZ n=1 Tax=Parazoarcus communis SWub3 = DSM 12120 TaxID=1121029 RepID=A0A323V0L1_9RHOO|nr:cell division protein FtsZ [Parazoarcus communis]NMG47345.1 cell division protein FtsZ [Parazoarcus communis]NMG70143.1 cell division protein FtsZ [Parazoarcus communis SWub3 = DSM 12120]PZA18315.1 cell division protein FtsZ [Azoarcus communis] [Parazoarcus communis SWub3 = DSM 12120]